MLFTTWCQSNKIRIEQGYIFIIYIYSYVNFKTDFTHFFECFRVIRFDFSEKNIFFWKYCWTSQEMYLVTVVRIKSPPPLLCNFCWPPFLFVEWFSFKLPTITVPPYFNTFKRVQKSHNAGGGGVFKHDAFRNTFQKYGNKKLWFFIISWREGFSRCVLHALVGHVFNHVQFKKGPKKHKLRVVWGVRGLVRACLSILQISHFVPHKKGGGGLVPQRRGDKKTCTSVRFVFTKNKDTHAGVSYLFVNLSFLLL